MTDVKKTLGLRIKELRKLRGISQEKLAEKVGIEQNNISRIENGINYPSAETLNNIALALNVDINELFCFRHHQSYEEIYNELLSIIRNEDNARLLYKFFITLNK